MLNYKKNTYSSTWAGHSTWIQGRSSPTDIYTHFFISNVRITHLRLRISCNNITCKLKVAFRLNISPMILIEITHLVHEVNGCRHVGGNINTECTILSSITWWLINRRVIHISLFFDTIHNNKECNRENQEYDSHDNIKDNSLLECGLS